MSQEKPCKVKIVTSPKHTKRAVMFLVEHSASFVNIEEAFCDLDEDVKDFFNVSFDYWIDSLERKHRYHGWDKSEYGGKYTECFVFKCNNHRLYGFLCHPKEPDDLGFYACVIVLQAEKNQWKTDKTELKRAEEMRQDPNVQAACKKAFSDKEGK